MGPEVTTEALLEELVLERSLPPDERERESARNSEIREEIVRRDDAVPALVGALRAGQQGESTLEKHRWIVRRHIASRLLAAIPEAREALVGLLRDASDEVRDAATGALVDTGDAWRALLEPSNGEDVLRATLRALIRQQSLGAAEPFVCAFAGDPRVGPHATEALSWGGAPSLDALAGTATEDAARALVAALARAPDPAPVFARIAAIAHGDKGWALLDSALAALARHGVLDQAFAHDDGAAPFATPEDLALRAAAWLRPPEPLPSEVVSLGPHAVRVATRSPGSTGLFPMHGEHYGHALDGRALRRAADSEVRIGSTPVYRVTCWRWHSAGEYNRVCTKQEHAPLEVKPIVVPESLTPAFAASELAALRPGRYMLAIVSLEVRKNDDPPFSRLPWSHEEEDEKEVDLPEAATHFLSEERQSTQIALLPTAAALDAHPVALVWRIAEELALRDHDPPVAAPGRARFYGALLQGSARIPDRGRARVLLVHALAHPDDQAQFLALIDAHR